MINPKDVAASRAQVVRRALDMMATMPKAAAARELGVNLATLTRWMERFASGGEDALEPGCSTGRPAVAASLDQAAIDAIRRKVLKTGSAAFTYAWFVDDPRCPDDLREYLIAKLNCDKPLSLPMSLRRAANCTPEMKAMLRGPVAYSHIGFKCRHSDMIIDPATDEPRPLEAGDLRIYDDMSLNEPFWFELEPGQIETRARRGDKLAERYGVAVGRQGLYCMDARGKVLGFELICRARDAYTAADVLRFMRNIDEEYGLERIGRILEQSVWRSRTITGQLCELRDEDAAAIAQAVAGLSSLGIIVEYVHTSEGKALLEGWFHLFQKAMSLCEDTPGIGRKRGEMERENKTMTRIQAGVMHPSEVMHHYTEAAEKARKAIVWLNGRRKYGRIQNGVPDEVYYRDTTAKPLRRIGPQHHGVYMPLKHETEIRHGCVEKKIDGELYRFCNPELFSVLGAKYRLMIAFDPTNPAAGAEVFNLEVGSRNVLKKGAGEWLGSAEWEPARVLFGYTDEVGESIERRKRFNRAFKSAYAGTGIFGKRSIQKVESRDGRGNAMAVEGSAAFSGGGAGSGRDPDAVILSRTSPASAAGPDCEEPKSRLPKLKNVWEMAMEK